MMKIDKGVVMPTARGGVRKYHFAEMSVGDSFFVEINQHTISCAAGAYGKNHKMKFATRREGKGVRVWRIK